MQFDQYNVYLDSVTRHYSTNKTVMAYVIFAEPSWKWANPHGNAKIMVSNWSRKWYYIVKKNAPNQLVTYGLDGISNVLFWDPAAQTYDFLSMHFYHGVSDPNKSKMATHSYFRWMNDNIEDVWALGETGFSGTEGTCQADPRVGSEIAQYQYAEYTMLKALSCGCKGYSCWQYQEIKWNDCLQDHLGIFTYYPHGRAKQVASSFPSYPPQPQYMACNRPDCYYNIPDYPHANIYGVVLDQNANPIKDAYVVAWPTVAGCDSVVTLHLTINDTNQTDLYVSACENFTWNEETYTVSGDYIYSHQGTNGCLQADTLHLTINHSVATEEYLTICESDLPYTYHDTVFLPGTPESLSVSTSLLTESGCDSTVTLHLTVIDTALRIELLTADFCENMSAELVAVTQMTDYLWNTGEEMPNITVTRPGLYSVTVL